MKHLWLLALACLVIAFAACADDDSREGYMYHVVDFFAEHEDFRVAEAVFETVTEQILIREAHRSEGATFETVTEVVLVRDAHTRFRIADSQMIYLVSNAETNTIKAIECFSFYDEAAIKRTEMPAVYTTRSFQKVVSPGTGSVIPAVYEVRTYERLVSDAEVVVADGVSRAFERIRFRVPESMSIRAYLDDQFAQQSITDCVEGNAYRIVE